MRLSSNSNKLTSLNSVDLWPIFIGSRLQIRDVIYFYLIVIIGMGVITNGAPSTFEKYFDSAESSIHGSVCTNQSDRHRECVRNCDKAKDAKVKQQISLGLDLGYRGRALAKTIKD